MQTLILVTKKRVSKNVGLFFPDRGGNSKYVNYLSRTTYHGYFYFPIILVIHNFVITISNTA